MSVQLTKEQTIDVATSAAGGLIVPTSMSEKAQARACEFWLTKRQEAVDRVWNVLTDVKDSLSTASPCINNVSDLLDTAVVDADGLIHEFETRVDELGNQILVLREGVDTVDIGEIVDNRVSSFREYGKESMDYFLDQSDDLIADQSTVLDYMSNVAQSLRTDSSGLPSLITSGLDSTSEVVRDMASGLSRVTTDSRMGVLASYLYDAITDLSSGASSEVTDAENNFTFSIDEFKNQTTLNVLQGAWELIKGIGSCIATVAMVAGNPIVKAIGAAASAAIGLISSIKSAVQQATTINYGDSSNMAYGSAYADNLSCPNRSSQYIDIDGIGYNERIPAARVETCYGTLMFSDQIKRDSEDVRQLPFIFYPRAAIETGHTRAHSYDALHHDFVWDAEIPSTMVRYFGYYNQDNESKALNAWLNQCYDVSVPRLIDSSSSACTAIAGNTARMVDILIHRGIKRLSWAGNTLSNWPHPNRVGYRIPDLKLSLDQFTDVLPNSYNNWKCEDMFDYALHQYCYPEPNAAEYVQISWSGNDPITHDWVKINSWASTKLQYITPNNPVTALDYFPNFRSSWLGLYVYLMFRIIGTIASRYSDWRYDYYRTLANHPGDLAAVIWNSLCRALIDIANDEEFVICDDNCSYIDVLQFDDPSDVETDGDFYYVKDPTVVHSEDPEIIASPAVSPPNVDARSLVIAVVTAVVVTVATVTTLLLVRRKLRRSRRLKAIRREEAAKSAQEAYAKDPSKENGKAFLKAQRKFQRYATRTGYSSNSIGSFNSKTSAIAEKASSGLFDAFNDNAAGNLSIITTLISGG